MTDPPGFLTDPATMTRLLLGTGSPTTGDALGLPRCTGLEAQPARTPRQDTPKMARLLGQVTSPL